MSFGLIWLERLKSAGVDEGTLLLLTLRFEEYVQDPTQAQPLNTCLAGLGERKRRWKYSSVSLHLSLPSCARRALTRYLFRIHAERFTDAACGELLYLSVPGYGRERAGWSFPNCMLALSRTGMQPCSVKIASSF